MRISTVVFSLVAVILAYTSATIFEPTIYSAVVPISSQFHSQDSLGQYSYAYSGGPSAKIESKTLDGLTRGSYSYVDGDGILQTVQYTADSLNGFRAAATNLPKAPVDDKSAPEPVQETPEVAKARAEHLAAYREAAIRAAKYPDESADAEAEVVNGNGDSNGNGNGDGSGEAGNNGNGGVNGNGNGNGQITVEIPSTPAATTDGNTLTVAGLPITSYGYHLNSPLHALSVAAYPTVYSAPVATAYAYSAPILTRSAAIAAAGIRSLEHQ